MARRTSVPTPAHVQLSPDQMRRGIERLRQRLDELNEWDPQSVKSRWDDPEVQTLKVAIESTVSRVFGEGTVEHSRFEGAATLDRGSIYIGRELSRQEMIAGFVSGKTRAVVLLNEAIRFLEESLEDTASEQPGPTENTRASLSREVFIVHGHDEAAKEAVARFLANAGFKPIILHEQASRGRTIIEKVEAHANVGFAVVLLTPDDVGGKGQDSLRPRARQNVILELGYFIGKLGRERVCALRKGDLETPSDFDGVTYIDYDPRGAWKAQLAHELQAAGLSVDWAKAMGA